MDTNASHTLFYLYYIIETVSPVSYFRKLEIVFRIRETSRNLGSFVEKDYPDVYCMRLQIQSGIKRAQVLASNTDDITCLLSTNRLLINIAFPVSTTCETHAII